MTERTSKTLKGAGLVSLATLMLFGDWLIEKTQAASTRADYVTEARFVRDSIAVRAELNVVLIELRRTTMELTETNQRLREVCERLRAGCR